MNNYGYSVFLPLCHAHQVNNDWNVDAPSYDFTKLNPDSAEDKAIVDKYFLWEGDFGGRDVPDGKVFK